MFSVWIPLMLVFWRMAAASGSMKMMLKLKPNKSCCLVHLVTPALTQEKNDALQIAFYSVGSEMRSLSEKKWFDIKLNKHVTARKRDICATGGGQSTGEHLILTHAVPTLLAIQHSSALLNIPTEQAGPSNIHTECTFILMCKNIYFK